LNRRWHYRFEDLIQEECQLEHPPTVAVAVADRLDTAETTS